MRIFLCSMQTLVRFGYVFLVRIFLVRPLSDVLPTPCTASLLHLLGSDVSDCIKGIFYKNVEIKAYEKRNAY